MSQPSGTETHTTATTEAPGHNGEQPGGILSPQPGLMFWTVLTFICLFLLLRKLAWKPMLAMIDERVAPVPSDEGLVLG